MPRLWWALPGHTLPRQTLLLGRQPCARRSPDSPLPPRLQNQGWGGGALLSPELFQAEGLRWRLQQSQEWGFSAWKCPSNSETP